MTTYPAGTNIREIICFNRGYKVIFGCNVHTQYAYMSKDPFCSQMFPANEETQMVAYGIKQDECAHTLKDDVWVTVSEYTNDEEMESRISNLKSKVGKHDNTKR